MGLLSLAVIGGAFFGIFYLITMAFPDAFFALAAEFAELDKKSKKFAKLHQEVEAGAK